MDSATPTLSGCSLSGELGALSTLRPLPWHGDGLALRTPAPLVRQPPLRATPPWLLFPPVWATSLSVAATGGEQECRGDGGRGAPSEPRLTLPLRKKLAAWASSSGSASDTLHTESERCSGDIRSPPSLPQKEEERVGEADMVPRLAGAGAGMTGGGFVMPLDDDGDDPSSHLPLREEKVPLLLGDGMEGRRW